MSIFAHAEKNHVEHRPPKRIEWNSSADFGAGQFRGFGQDLFAANSMNMICGNSRRPKQFLEREPIIAFLMFRRDAAFIGPKEVYRGEREIPSFCACGDGSENGGRDSAAGARDIIIVFGGL